MDQTRGQHRAGGADRMAVRDRAALDIDDILAQAELARDHDRDGGERLVDLDALQVGDRPAGTRQRLAHRWDRPKAE